METGWEQVSAVLPGALVSVINEAEVISRLVGRGQTAEKARGVVSALPYHPVDLDRALCQRAGALWAVTKPLGLSLEDRCCLALAERERLPALTADHAWTNVPLNVEVRLIAGRGRR
jgi:PIN domain nuclease of toxin-antitoxin system